MGRAQPAKTHRIGYLLLAPIVDRPSAERAAFLDELRTLGYAEGRNLRIEYRSAQGSREKLGPLARELVQANMEVIVWPPRPRRRGLPARRRGAFRSCSWVSVMRSAPSW
jgi:putative ABC transport system substrate-binding protein